jgi:integration host factor subunit beta
LAIVKSNLLKQLSDSYPNFLKKDLEKFLNIILSEIKQALYKGERVELRGFGVWSIHIQKARISRNPKTGEKIETPQKKTIHFKMGKELFKKLNNLNNNE